MLLALKIVERIVSKRSMYTNTEGSVKVTNCLQLFGNCIRVDREVICYTHVSGLGISVVPEGNYKIKKIFQSFIILLFYIYYYYLYLRYVFIIMSFAAARYCVSFSRPSRKKCFSFEKSYLDFFSILGKDPLDSDLSFLAKYS